ncbi:hypothetical protein ABIA14_000844 [Sinorhizobium fredii]|uniref:hypothetical protein n=1 Tax=Rhizobium fredii TaxID=380 RepID=UPI0035153A10
MTDVLIEIKSTATADGIRHFCMLEGAKTQEGWGINGIETILDRHLVEGNGRYQYAHPDIAKQFFRKMEDVMKGVYTMYVDLVDDGDVVDIRIARPGRDTLTFPNRFVLFESTGWWHDPALVD